ncbi:UBN2 domain-containing protein [Abeliophyllum distichum]|uniref:UBN2 domain-containing protein n=1 Tax=Abeliophyllum distichum TaxID=126358 RepID=A0ABD1SAS0_9LAMI
MKQDEPIVDMITRFTDIINGLKGFDRKFTNGELVSKMLRSLSEDWNSLRMLIENTKDINTYPLEELYGTLMTYELNNAETKEKTRRSKEEMKEPPKKQIALKSTNDEGSSNTNMSDEELDDLVLLQEMERLSKQ